MGLNMLGDCEALPRSGEGEIRRGVFTSVCRRSSPPCEAGLLIAVCSFIVLLIVGVATWVATQLIAAVLSGASLPDTAQHAPPMQYLSCGGIGRLRVVHPVLLAHSRLAQNGPVPGR